MPRTKASYFAVMIAVVSGLLSGVRQPTKDGPV
jgi:hypothetical protein